MSDFKTFFSNRIFSGQSHQQTSTLNSMVISHSDWTWTIKSVHGVPLLFCTTSFPWLLRCHSRFSYFPGSSPPGTLAVPFHHPHNKFWSNSEMERLKPFLYIQPSQVFSSPMTLLILSTAMIPPFLPPDQSFRLAYGLIYSQLCLVI